MIKIKILHSITLIFLTFRSFPVALFFLLNWVGTIACSNVWDLPWNVQCPFPQAKGMRPSYSIFLKCLGFISFFNSDTRPAWARAQGCCWWEPPEVLQLLCPRGVSPWHLTFGKVHHHQWRGRSLFSYHNPSRFFINIVLLPSVRIYSIASWGQVTASPQGLEVENEDEMGACPAAANKGWKGCICTCRSRAGTGQEQGRNRAGAGQEQGRSRDAQRRNIAKGAEAEPAKPCSQGGVQARSGWRARGPPWTFFVPQLAEPAAEFGLHKTGTAV